MIHNMFTNFKSNDSVLCRRTKLKGIINSFLNIFFFFYINLIKYNSKYLNTIQYQDFIERYICILIAGKLFFIIYYHRYNYCFKGNKFT